MYLFLEYLSVFLLLAKKNRGLAVRYKLIFTNYGTFIPGSVEKVVIEDAPEGFCRNKFLATAIISGEIREMDYARLLAKIKDLSLEDIILLDDVKKRLLLV